MSGNISQTFKNTQKGQSLASEIKTIQGEAKKVSLQRIKRRGGEPRKGSYTQIKILCSKIRSRAAETETAVEHLYNQGRTFKSVEVERATIKEVQNIAIASCKDIIRLCFEIIYSYCISEITDFLRPVDEGTHVTRILKERGEYTEVFDRT